MELFDSRADFKVFFWKNYKVVKTMISKGDKFNSPKIGVLPVAPLFI
jgi:hypothetical protein